ncbi:hypothetical protein ACLB2K_027352 [Fragaria x ananassa]
MKVQFISEKRKTEAFKVAAGFRGVSNVSVEADKDQIVVTGVGVDSVCLVKSLRKKKRSQKLRVFQFNGYQAMFTIPCPMMSTVDSSVHCSASTVKQKIVIKVQFSSEKRKTEAFKVAAGFRGVSNVSVEADKDQVVVIGVGIDSVCLAKSLRKKLSYAVIVSVEEVKEPEEKKPKVQTIPIQWTSTYVEYPVVCW